MDRHSHGRETRERVTPIWETIMQAWPRLDRVDWLLVGAVVFIVTVLMLRTRSSTDSTPNLDIGDLMSQLHQELNSHATKVAAKAQESPLFLVKSAHRRCSED